MTTNSFGGALPPFDFPKPDAPAISRLARATRFYPVAAITATAVGIAYYNYTTGRKQQAPPMSYASMHFNNAAQRQAADNGYITPPTAGESRRPSS